MRLARFLPKLMRFYSILEIDVIAELLAGITSEARMHRKKRKRR